MLVGECRPAAMLSSAIAAAVVFKTFLIPRGFHGQGSFVKIRNQSEPFNRSARS